MTLNKNLVGKRYGQTTYEVTAAAIERYARATNDENPRYISEDIVATPVFPVVPAFNSFMAAAMDSELGADLMRLVHGAEEHLLYEPIRPGDRLTISPVLESVEQKDTGETFTILARLENQHGNLAGEVRGTMFIRGPRPTRRADRAAPRTGGTPDAGEAVYEEATKVDDDQTARYAEASGDHNPLHLDENVAKMAGLPGIINHGMCTMAIAVKGAVDGLAGGTPERIKRAAVRFSRPVFPGQEITTRFWRVAEDDEIVTYSFETYNPAGTQVIKDAVVEIARR